MSSLGELRVGFRSYHAGFGPLRLCWCKFTSHPFSRRWEGGFTGSATTPPTFWVWPCLPRQTGLYLALDASPNSEPLRHLPSIKASLIPFGTLRQRRLAKMHARNLARAWVGRGPSKRDALEQIDPLHCHYTQFSNTQASKVAVGVL